MLLTMPATLLRVLVIIAVFAAGYSVRAVTIPLQKHWLIQGPEYESLDECQKMADYLMAKPEFRLDHDVFCR
jgi:hypothetical protein